MRRTQWLTTQNADDAQAVQRMPLNDQGAFPSGKAGPRKFRVAASEAAPLGHATGGPVLEIAY